jgi:hypothetical protein
LLSDFQMVEFTETMMRKFCRNPKCRMKLPTPTSNERAAFCCRGCHSAYHRRHCLVCDGTIVQPKRGERLICKKAACINAFRDNSATYRYQGSQTAESISETPDFIDSKQALKPDRGWFAVAGPELTPDQFHCAIVGAREAVESVADVNKAHWRSARAGGHGYRVRDPDTPKPLAENPPENGGRSAVLIATITDDLSISDFLLRQQPMHFAEAA